jgi:hypothetical protein
MSEINSIAQGTYTLGQTSATTYQAGPGISITQPSEGTVRISNDETVLWEGNGTGSDTFNLSESMANFETIKILYNPWSDNTSTHYFEFDYNRRNSTMNYGIMSDVSTYTLGTLRLFFVTFGFTDTQLKVTNICYADGSFTVQTLDKSRVKVYKIVGINRISGGNA